jgi:exopolysaccharide biosynthesis polyprenyl glycosylphosphotransferase
MMPRHLPRWLKWALVASDIVLINLALYVSYKIRYNWQWFRTVDPAYNNPYSVYIPFAVVLTALLLIVFRSEGVYDQRRNTSLFDTLYTLGSGATTGIVVAMAGTLAYPPLTYSRLIFLYAGFLIVVFLSFSRIVLTTVSARMRARGVGIDRVLIIGAGEVGRTVMRTIVARPELGYRIVGLLDDNPEKGETDIGPFRALGGLDKLPLVLSNECITEVIIALPWSYHRKILSLIAQCERARVRVRLVPDIFQLTLSRVDVDDLGGIPLIGVKPVTIRGASLAIKRAMDLVLGGLSLIAGLPLMGAIALAIRLDSPGPAVFKQTRIGKGGKEFMCYKFRSMREGAEAEQENLQSLNEASGPLFKIKQDPRTTRVGRFLRRTSLDELPQIYNVLRGEMSLVGPRPPLPSEVAQYQEWHKQRLEAPPGMTGLWQVSGRSQLSFDEMCLLDIFYIENYSPMLDLRIMLRTLPAVLSRQGAY